MEILFYSVSFCPPKSITFQLVLLIRLSWLLSQGIRDGSEAGEESQGGNFGNKRRATEKRSPIGPYFQLNSPNNFCVN